MLNMFWCRNSLDRCLISAVGRDGRWTVVSFSTLHSYSIERSYNNCDDFEQILS